MCGIMGYTGSKEAASVLINGLTSLEYRGYDSAGISVLGPSNIPAISKTAGKLVRLKEILDGSMPEGSTGIGHTRWATHGEPTKLNSHPHGDCANEIIVVHNGIVENYLELKTELISSGHSLISETDSEIIPHLIEAHMKPRRPLIEAVRLAAKRIKGANAVAIMSARHKGDIVAFRLGNAGGIVVGYGEKEMLIASDLPALLPYTKNIAYLTDGELVYIHPFGVEYSLLNGQRVDKKASQVGYDPMSAAKGSYRHFMLKEIHEQPEAVINAIRRRVDFQHFKIILDDLPFTDHEIMGFERVVFVGMGTSLHAAMIGRTWMESLARIPSEFDNSSEFRYRNPIIDDKTLVVSVCQSGETADTLAAMNEAKRMGARQLTLSNYPGTQSSRIADGTMLIQAGPEIGVAASKTFVCSLTSLYLLALYFADIRGTVNQACLTEIVKELAHLPELLGEILKNVRQYQDLAHSFHNRSDFLYLGRGIHYPIAMEGALKLKEISYIHAEGYAAGEMKHGPISLIDEHMPIVALSPKNGLYDKMINNINEAKTRGGTVIVIATEGDDDIRAQADHVLYVPKASELVAPILTSVPLQLLAYYIAARRGCDIDQPRNLAKSVTVE